MKTTAALFVTSLWMVAAGPALAHHAEPLYDLKNPATMKGVVGKVEWQNPHVYLHVIVKNDPVKAEDWTLELTSPNALKRYGWTPSTIKAGDSIVCTGGRARSGAKVMRCVTVELPDGKKLRTF